MFTFTDLSRYFIIHLLPVLWLKYGGSWNNTDNPCVRIYVPCKVKGLTVILNLMSDVNETRFLVQCESCKCKCRLNENSSNSKQKWK